jgi:hypothetical protein
VIVLVGALAAIVPVMVGALWKMMRGKREVQRDAVRPQNGGPRP